MIMNIFKNWVIFDLIDFWFDWSFDWSWLSETSKYTYIGEFSENFKCISDHTGHRLYRSYPTWRQQIIIVREFKYYSNIHDDNLLYIIIV